MMPGEHETIPNQLSPIVELSGNDLKPGVIWSSFQDGAKAVRLVGDNRIDVLWNELITKQFDHPNALFWENGIRNFAFNHRKGQHNVGDMWRFVQGSIAHVARKVIIYPESGGTRIQRIPEHFWNEDFKEIFSQEVLWLTWEFVTAIFKSCMPANFKTPSYAVSIQFLKYPDSTMELDRVFDLLDDSSAGRWIHVGRKLDILREIASGPFNLRGARDLFAFGSLIPGLSQLLRKANNSFGQANKQGLDKDLITLGKPHLDSTRALSILASERDMVSTDIFDGNQWHELPLDTNSMTIFPGRLFCKELGLEPTLHRYSIKTNHNQSTAPKKNLSLLFGPVDLESNIPLSKLFI